MQRYPIYLAKELLYGWVDGSYSLDNGWYTCDNVSASSGYGIIFQRVIMKAGSHSHSQK
jgi:hypothetical protein